MVFTSQATKRGYFLQTADDLLAERDGRVSQTYRPFSVESQLEKFYRKYGENWNERRDQRENRA